MFSWFLLFWARKGFIALFGFLCFFCVFVVLRCWYIFVVSLVVLSFFVFLIKLVLWNLLFVCFCLVICLGF